MTRLRSLSAVLLVLVPTACGQKMPGDSLPSSVTGGFLYGVVTGRSFWVLNNAPGWRIAYSYRAQPWLLLEAGLEQIVRPTGSSICCRYVNSADDELYLVPFGARYIWQPRGAPLGLSLGGGGAYANHSVGAQFGGGPFNASAWGAQAVAAGNYALTRSGRFRLGLQARFYYLDLSRYQKGRLFTIGPTFSFSWK